MNMQTSAESVQQQPMADFLAQITAILADPERQLPPNELAAHGVPPETIQQLMQIDSIVHQHLAHQQMVQQAAAFQQQSLVDGSMKETFDTISKIKEGLNHSIQSSRQIQTWTAVMYLAMFCLGFALVITGAFFAKAEGTNDWFTITFGASGLVLLLAVFLTNPPRELQRVRANYVQLSMLGWGWINELLDGSGVRSATLNGIKSNAEKIERYQQLATHQTTITQHYMQMMERYAEPRGKGDAVPLLQAAAQASTVKT